MEDSSVDEWIRQHIQHVNEVVDRELARLRTPLFLRTHLRPCPLVTTGGVCNCGA